MKKLLLVIVSTMTLFSCKKETIVIIPNIPTTTDTSEIAKWNMTEHRYSIVYNNGERYVLANNGSYFIYKLNGYTEYVWEPLMSSTLNRPNFSSSNFERGDTLTIDFDSKAYAKIEVFLDGKIIASDSGTKRIEIQTLLK